MDVHRKRLSVIIPGFNVPESWWRRCVSSVLAACGPDDEVICIDDGSPEKPEFLNGLAATDNRLKVIMRSRNCGPSSVRNTGMAMAQGKYIAFVDADDDVLPEVYDRSIADMDRTGADVAIFGVKTIWTEDGLAKVSVLPAQFYELLGPAEIRALTDACLYHYVWNKVYRTLFLKTSGIMFEPSEELEENAPLVFPGEDGVFNLRCVISGAKWCVVPFVGYRYYRTGTTLLSTYKRNDAIGRRYVSNVWRQYKDSTPGGRESLGWLDERTDVGLIKCEWDNIWRAGTPYGLREKWRFLKSHRSELSGPMTWTFLRQMCYSFLRNHCYIRPVRRWNIRRVNRGVFEWKGNK